MQVHRLFEKPNFLVQNLQYVSPLIILKVLIFEVISNVSSTLKKIYSTYIFEKLSIKPKAIYLTSLELTRRANVFALLVPYSHIDDEH